MTQERQKEIWRNAADKYRASKHGSSIRKKYAQSSEGKAAKHRSFKRAYSTPKGKSKILETHKNYRETLEGRAVCLLNDARTRARKKQLPFTLTKEWVVQHLQSEKCAQTGDSFSYTLIENSRNMFAPSLDQIVPNTGYAEENTQIVCWWWNAFKHNRTDDEAWQHFRVLHERQSSS
jgi:hypothetical protein